MSDEFPDTQRFVDEGVIPTPPAPPLASGQEAAVALWRQDDLAAVLVIAHDAEEEEEPFEQYIELFHREGDRWQFDTSAGTDWPVAYGDGPLRMEEPELPGAGASTVNEDDPSSFVCFMSGIAPRGVATVRAIIGDAEQTVDADPITGGFLVRTDHIYPAIRLVAVDAP